MSRHRPVLLLAVIPLVALTWGFMAPENPKAGADDQGRIMTSH